MPRLLGKLPAYRKHKATGQAVVTAKISTLAINQRWRLSSSEGVYFLTKNRLPF